MAAAMPAAMSHGLPTTPPLQQLLQPAKPQPPPPEKPQPAEPLQAPPQAPPHLPSPHPH